MLMVSSSPVTEPVTSALAPLSLSWVRLPVSSVVPLLAAMAGAASGSAVRVSAEARARAREVAVIRKLHLVIEQDMRDSRWPANRQPVRS
ncbi:hypothetical protein GCM10009756_30910 [Pseudokineococcus marinus]